ncbi:CRAL/TRIO domain-containing protein [Dichomitus squalens LYAD-421 SS1]|uniref:CRAL/TRIO domain-containing protein n=1 Tax=Dichomitus squalens (strain LYAD-421) TaxID=732165 RepID=UPI0004415547|nr:CRAL/TRIO domain-containing protein [Dichomitus squalens LYAD-421 SS1]EJF65029.1 CRAL/TRIO domain-containing protein [Dichomitus squalens LYAD-421 SS1]
MSMEDVLRQKKEELVEIYKSNLDNARNLQRTLRKDILPGLVHELYLDDEGERRATSWLYDLQSIFRLLRRHKFTVPFALENARDVLLWRLAVIPTEIPRSSTSFIRCLPTNVRDPFGRPIVVVKLCDLLGPSHDVRSALIHYMELLRLHLHTLNHQQETAHGRERPILQYIVLMDIDRMPMQSQAVDLITWFLYELIPRFPGMLAAAFILNHSWAHTGIWNIVKRLLPKSALTRIFFPSQDELLGFLSAAAIPRDYGGSLPLLTELEDPLENLVVNLEEGTSGVSDSPAQPAVSAASASSSQTVPRVPSISTYSHLNPYFGYPVSRQGAPTPKLRHGRRRKRDLLRTLAALWWSKWKNRFLLLLSVVVCVITYRLRRKPRMLRWSQGMRGILRLPARI